MTWRIALQLALSGLSVGSIYALSRCRWRSRSRRAACLNFAQGELVTLGAYIALVLTSYGLPYPRDGAGDALHRRCIRRSDRARSFIRPIVGAPEFTLVIATFAHRPDHPGAHSHSLAGQCFLPARALRRTGARGRTAAGQSVLSRDHRQHRRAGRPRSSCSSSAPNSAKRCARSRSTRPPRG